jgi:aryl-alcohol dehydrogenase-like predicted oxidoreductase
MRAVEDSLRRLQVDEIDLYQSHWPDESSPLEETFRAFEDMIRQGKVRYIGCSNHSAVQLQETLDFCAAHHLPRYESLQPHYNLVHRHEYEAELMALCQKENLGVIPYSPLEGGFLTGKYQRDGSAPAGSRGAGNERMRDYATKDGFAILEALTDMAKTHQATVAQIALAWLLANSTITSAIIGANSAAQLTQLIPAASIALSVEEKARLDEMDSPK